MSKYDPLTVFLQSRSGRDVRMSFAEIEGILGLRLPEKSKRIRAWWSNNPSNNVMTRAWLAAGYKSAQVDVAGETLVFVRVDGVEGFGEMKQATFKPEQIAKPDGGKGTKAGRHPAWGALKGMITLLPDVDYTAPADPDWGKVYEE
ncbi:MAG TPA: hypothetical protein VGV07_14120 [Devosia sp.]|uniref:DUF7662 domain-containing protein n=1 Tax=Devosia sp. TaxID=1871048 RepID=UPI002DDC9D15|nr:hypothetical protein [Devosia sp.]HEV2516387.1 hypothetical protein [Devosia sp.]